MGTKHSCLVVWGCDTAQNRTFDSVVCYVVEQCGDSVFFSPLGCVLVA